MYFWGLLFKTFGYIGKCASVNLLEKRDIMLEKDQLLFYNAKANVFKALGHPIRLQIIENLEQGELCVCELTALFDVDMSTVSKHLTILKNVGLIQPEKRGKQIFYSLKVPCIMKFVQCINDVIKNQAAESQQAICNLK